MDTQTVEQLEDLRSRIAAGEEFSKEELAASIMTLRAERANGISASKAPAGKPLVSTLPTDLNDLFS